MERRLTVLIQAYACNPYKGSEEGVGWGWVCAIAEKHDVHVLTAEYHRDDISNRLQEMPELNDSIRFHFVPAKKWHYRPTPRWIAIENSALKPLMNMAYRLWQRDAFHEAKALMQEIRFDLIHVITYVGFRFPGAYWKLPLPLVWGPIGGLENTPWRYFPVLGWRGGVIFAGRNILNTLDKALLRGPKRAFRKAEGGIIAATTAIKEEIRRWYSVDSVVRPEIGAVPSEPDRGLNSREPDEPLKIVWSAQHIPGKALPLLLDTLAVMPDKFSWRLTVLGDGPLSDKWKRLAAKRAISDRITWAGRVNRDEAIRITADSHVMVITSIHDLTSSVLVEALSVGVPVICPDHYGFHDAVNESCGIRVDPSSLAAIRSGIRNGLLRIYRDEPYRQDLAVGAKKRARHFQWSETRDLVSNLYQSKVQ